MRFINTKVLSARGQENDMHADIVRCRETIETAVRGVSAAAAAISRDGHWSIAEIVEHLALTYTGTTKGLDRVLSGAKPLPPAPSLAERFRTAVVVVAGHFPSGRKAPRHVVPSGLTYEEALSRAYAGLDGFDAAAVRAEARFGRARVLMHPILGPFSVADWRRFHLVHTRHHARQIAARRA
jgi:Protein of unknown function (DUF1569)